MLTTLDPIITPEVFLEHYPKLKNAGEPTLPRLLHAADSLCAAYLGYPPYASSKGSRSMALRSYVLYIDGPAPAEPRALCTCLRPIETVTEVAVREDPSFEYTALVEDTDYAIDEAAGVLIGLGDTPPWPALWRGTRVTLTAGYREPPPDLVACLAFTVQALMDRHGVQQRATSSVAGITDSPTDTADLLPEAVRAALDRLHAGCVRG